ncbi:hypothetical protein BST11_15075 [Mycobacterium alsense]|uniref:RNA chaperone ProQ C-terminal domain-containing protein n=1 Tax=Mycobacterium alsense TaxID=324058 RepID=A0AA41XIW3_9MYCO|nr:hypothetical protein [Mycobacterium alsense]MCV7377548.1 hypothetical protein [Mycobacterium alsense]OQZ90027.1 hypothetical protein BST11_15075 [Mycobacterium alsense]
MVTRRPTQQLKAGVRVRVRIGGATYNAVITDVRGDRIFVTVDPDSDAPLDTFYHRDELLAKA